MGSSVRHAPRVSSYTLTFLVLGRSLQSAVDECDVETDKPCAHVTPAPEAEVNACKIPAIVKDVGDGAFGKLSG